MSVASSLVVSDRTDRMAWFNEARFGLFLHWGLYSIWGRGEWVLYKEQIPIDAYNNLANEFTPTHFDADAWAELAVRAGMRYMVLTARHHDGYCLFDSQTTNFTSTKTRANRDFVREYTDACRRAGLKVGIYYSLMDWQFPGYFSGPHREPELFEALVQHVHAQVRELMTNYGQIDMLWYDGGNLPASDVQLMATYWRSQELNAMARSLQPQLLINSRSGLPEDFDTAEQHITPPANGRDWEACMTIGNAWGYNAGETEFKSTEQLLQTLVFTARHGGNLLLNVGPRADGTVQPEFVERLHGMGDWMQRHGESIYGSRRCPYSETEHTIGPATVCDRKVYFHLFTWPGAAARIAGLPSPIQDVRLLTTGEAVPVQPSSHMDVQTLSLPATPPDALCPVLAVGVNATAQIGHPPALLQPRDTSLYEPALPPVVWGDTLAAAGLTPQAEVRASDAWCPGWQDLRVFTTASGQLDCELAVPVSGRYTLEIGLIADAAMPLAVVIDDLLVKRVSRLRTPGYPHLLTLPPMTLAGGTRRLTLRARRGLPFGIYGLRLVPNYHVLPSPLWSTIGPFPTVFDIQHTGLEHVRAALATVFPPETGYDAAAIYTGAGGVRVRWQTARSARGAHARQGVNFAFRCGTKVTGVCYARTIIESPVAREAELLLGCDWWVNAFLNGEPIHSTRDAEKVAQDGAQFNTWKPSPARLSLRAGANELLVKCHQGSNACWFTAYLSDPGDLVMHP